MLAVLYLEDRQHPERVDDLVAEIRRHARQPAWEDGYIQGLIARNEGDHGSAQSIAAEIVAGLHEADPRREWVGRNLRALPVDG